MAISDTEWMEAAACASYPDPEAFHLPVSSKDPETRQRVKQAQALCTGCEARIGCGLFAVVEQQGGIWGGMGQHARTRRVNQAKRSRQVLSKAS